MSAPFSLLPSPSRRGVFNNLPSRVQLLGMLTVLAALVALALVRAFAGALSPH